MSIIRSISVVIPAYNEQDYIASILYSLLEQEEYPAEIIVVDNNSTDNTGLIVDNFHNKFKSRHVNLIKIKEIRPGVAIARNKGFFSATHPIIASTDADTIISKTWIKQIYYHFNNYDSIAVSGKILFFDSPILIRYLTRLGWYKFLHYTGKFIFGFMSVHTANCAVRIEAFKRCGGFDERIKDPGQCDDFEMSSRLSRYGNVRFDSQILAEISFRRYSTPKKMILNSFGRIKAWLYVGLRYSRKNSQTESNY